MNVSRRNFLRLAGTGAIAAATTAEIGLWSEFMSWLKRKPTWSIPQNVEPYRAYVHPTELIIGQYSDFVTMDWDCGNGFIVLDDLNSTSVVDNAITRELSYRYSMSINNLLDFGGPIDILKKHLDRDVLRSADKQLRGSAIKPTKLTRGVRIRPRSRIGRT